MQGFSGTEGEIYYHMFCAFAVGKFKDVNTLTRFKLRK